MRALSPLLAGLVLSLAAPALAQGGPPTAEWDSIRPLGDAIYRLHTRWTPGGGRGGGRSAAVTVQAFSADFRPRGRPARLYRGPAARAELATRDDGYAVVLYRGGEVGPFVRAAVRRVGAAPGRGTAQPELLELGRLAGAGWAPTNAAICATPEGYTVLWQEEPVGPGEGRRARSFMARVSPDGALAHGPAEVGVPWGFGAMAWNGAGYHLALFYDAEGEGRTRLNLVTLSPEGQPQQHPWWISDPQMVDEVHLARQGASMLVIYRGGPDGSLLRLVDSTGEGSWGGPTPPTRDLGRLAVGLPFTERLGAPGQVEIVSPAGPPAAN